MKLKSLLHVWTQKPFILLLALLAFSGSAFSQANYWSIFGNSGCSHSNRMSATTTPSSFSSVADLSDDYAAFWGSGLSPDLQNSIYDNVGNLLFSANVDGIYSSDGTQKFLFSWSKTYSNPCDPGDIYSIDMTGAASEIVIVPASQCKPNSYYVICWCAIYNDGGSHDYYNVLRAVEVDINPSTGALTFYDNLLGPQPDCYSYTYNYFKIERGSYEITADNMNTDGSRDIYTVNFKASATTGYTQILKWHIGADGTLPTASIDMGAGTTLAYPPSTTKAKILHVGSAKLLANACIGNGTLGHGNMVQTYDLSSHDFAYYIAPYSSHAYQNIWGFEYVPSLNVYCFAWEDADVHSDGGLVSCHVCYDV